MKKLKKHIKIILALQERKDFASGMIRGQSDAFLLLNGKTEESINELRNHLGEKISEWKRERDAISLCINVAKNISDSCEEKK